MGVSRWPWRHWLTNNFFWISFFTSPQASWFRNLLIIGLNESAWEQAALMQVETAKRVRDSRIRILPENAATGRSCIPRKPDTDLYSFMAPDYIHVYGRAFPAFNVLVPATEKQCARLHPDEKYLALFHAVLGFNAQTCRPANSMPLIKARLVRLQLPRIETATPALNEPPRTNSFEQ